MSEVDGNFIYLVKRYISDFFSKEDFESLVKALPKDDQIVYGGLIATGKRYNLSAYQNMLTCMGEKYGLEEVGRMHSFMAEVQIKGFFGYFVQLVNVNKLIDDRQKNWSKSFSQGKVSLIEHNSNYIILKVEDFKFNDAHRYGVEVYLRTWLEIVSNKEIESSNQVINDKTTEFIYKF